MSIDVVNADGIPIYNLNLSDAVIGYTGAQAVALDYPVTAPELRVVGDLFATELVVLSGDLLLGDSVHGVRRACRAAGAHAVIAGLWSVTDSSSAQLMSDLYVRLASAASPGEALHETTLDMLRRARMTARTPHPDSWAPFVVSGSVQAILRRDGVSPLKPIQVGGGTVPGFGRWLKPSSAECCVPRWFSTHIYFFKAPVTPEPSRGSRPVKSYRRRAR